MKIVIALGGNALGNNPVEQQELVSVAVKNIIPLIKEGHQIIINHGNGPQVGMINLAFTNSYGKDDIPLIPFAECTAMSQGYIGFHLQKALNVALKEENIQKEVVTLVSQVTVSENDPSFSNPTKPVGPFYTKEEADKLMEETNEPYVEDAGRGYRKVVASPKPIKIKEINIIKELSDNGHIVIAGGGGGIPVFEEDQTKGASAVIDKDLVSSLMAHNLNADLLIILTNVKQALINYGKEDETPINTINLETAYKYIEENHFAKGSMLPKIEAAIKFVENSGNKAIITSLDNLSNAINEIDSTIITK